MVYSVFVQRRDGTYLPVASCNDLEQAVQIVQTLSASYPQKYVVRDSKGNDVYVRGAFTLPSIRILVVDDYESWRNQVRLLLQARPEWQVIGEALDGSEAVQKARELKPDVILMDIHLPKLNGIEAARRIREHSPNSKIVFLSVENDPADVLQEALSMGVQHYVWKARAQSDLLPAIEAVLRGEQIVSNKLGDFRVTDAQGAKAARCHDVLFYPDDAVFLDRSTRYISAALGAGDVVAVVATESHRDNLFHQLKAESLDIDGEIKHGRYISLDVAETLSTFMVNDMPDWERFFEVVGGLVSAGAKAGKKEHSRVAICGECGPFLWAEGKVDAAMQLEQFLNQLATIYEFDVLCAYPLSSFHGEEHEREFQSICAEHSTVSRA